MYCSCVHTSMVGGAMLFFVGSMLLVGSSLVQLFVSSNLSVLTTSLTVLPLSVFV